MSEELDVELLVAIHEATTALVKAAHEHGALPSLRSREFITAPIEVRQAVLAVGGSSYALAADTLDSFLGDDYLDGRYHGQHALPAITELQRRRYPPNGDRDEWIRYGPDGPPAEAAA